MKVLVVEDDKIMRSLLAEVVFQRGHEVTAVREAETAWERWELEEFPLVLLDWQLPGMDGLELARRIREAPRGSHTVILLITGRDRREDLAAVLDAGANDYIAKPFDMEMLDVRLAVAERQVEEITQRKRAEEALAHQALHDALTDLPNRILLHDRLGQAILSAERTNGSLALLMMDLDRFKEVNDTFGHHWGDELLKQVSERLQAALRATDTVARLGGDEFAVVLPSARDAGEAVAAARKLLRILEVPFEVEGQALDVRASIGIALCPQHGDDAETLLRRADVAMYVAKRAGGGYAVYQVEHDHHTPGRLSLVSELRRAIDQDELILHYQPKVDIRTGQVVGVEALVRWDHPQLGLIMPGEFVPLAEQSGLIEPLSRWVLGTALRQCEVWRESGLEVPISVNLSMRNLRDPQLPEAIATLLERCNIEPVLLRIEVTENVLMNDPARAMEVLSRLKELGVHITIDDFGAGQASFGYLRGLVVDELKVDKSFIKDIADDEQGSALVRSAIQLGHNLGVSVLAEGVEDLKTWSVLSDLDCDQVQGYYLTEPLTAPELASWWSEWRHHPRPIRESA
jgi:diguanylate cyclase